MAAFGPSLVSYSWVAAATAASSTSWTSSKASHSNRNPHIKRMPLHDPSVVKRRRTSTADSALASSFPEQNNHNYDDQDASLNGNANNVVGRLEELKQQEQLLAQQLAAVRREKLSTLRSCPLKIGIVGFGRFGQFIAQTFCNHGHSVVVTSRSDYTDIAQQMGAKYVPLDQPHTFVVEEQLDVLVFCVSILSFEQTVQSFVPALQQNEHTKGPLIVDVLSVKEHPRKVLLDLLPSHIDLLLTHPMFGPDSGKNGWHNLNFVYEKTRIDGVLLAQDSDPSHHQNHPAHTQHMEHFQNGTTGHIHSVHEHSEAHVEAVDRMERFLSIWEEEGCNMVEMSCRTHDAHAANSQFITHLMGRILGQQGLAKTPIDTSGFRNVLKLVDSTTADSFDLFYGLFKFNTHSADTIQNLKDAMEDVVTRLKQKEQQEDQVKRQSAASVKVEGHRGQASIPE